MRSKVIKSHSSSQRDSWWFLIQDEDGTLHIEKQSDSDKSQNATRWSLNDALKERIASPELQELVGKMFD